jgi:hypothetical protein
VTCTGVLEPNQPCQFAGSVEQLTCGASTGCVLTAAGLPYCWAPPASVPVSPPSYAAQLPTQEPVASLAPKGFFFSSVSGQSEPCPLGTYSNAAGSITPICSGQCAAGTYSATYNSSCSDICPQGFYCPQGTAYPLPCPAGVFGSSQGLTSAACTLPCPTGKLSFQSRPLLRS